MDIDSNFIKALQSADADFFTKNLDKMITSTGIVPEFSRLLGDVMMAPMKDVEIPFFNKFLGRELEYGAFWQENALAIPTGRRYKPKATAEDAFGYYETEGIQSIYTMSYQGWLPQTLPSDLSLGEIVNRPELMGDFLSRITGNGRLAVQMSLDAMIGKKLVSSIGYEETVDTSDYVAYRKGLRDIVSDMRTNKGLYVDTDKVDPKKYLTAATSGVSIIMEEKDYNSMVSDMAVYPSPDKFVENANMVIVPEMPTPITTAEYAEGGGGGAFVEEPVNIDGEKPLAIIVSNEFMEYRPYRGQSRVNVNENGAGDFTNTHTIYKGSIGIRPWENAVVVTRDGESGA